MIVDAREVPADSVIDADVCIVGAGPAGITIARELSGLKRKIVLVESGGLRLEPKLQALGQPSRQLPGAGALGTRHQFGGNASAWNIKTHFGGNSLRLARLSATDFQPREWIGNSGWPISLADIDRYYRKASRIFGLAPGGWDAEDWESPGVARLPLTEDVETAMFQFGNGRLFHHDYRRELERSPNVTVYHHATALELETDSEALEVTAVRLASNPGREFHVRAKWMVLSGGGTACAQLLLQSDRAQNEGLGNRHDVVGRYYMDHPLIEGGNFIPTSKELFRDMALYDLRKLSSASVMGHLLIAEAAQRRERLPQLSMLFYPRQENYLDALNPRQLSAVIAGKRVRRAVKRKTLPLRSDMRLAILGLDGIAKHALIEKSSHDSGIAHGGWSENLSAKHKYGVFEVIHQAEQPPHRENRIYLDEARDAFGSRRIAIDWTWSDEDKAATMRGQELFADTLQRSGLGHFEIFRREGGPQVRFNSTAHYMGTTRMHEDPQQGVVDSNCRVHGIRNLYVASSSVFTTGGFANPTMTVVALALRLAEHIGALV